MKSKIFASFSGGRSSALMCKILLEKYTCTEIQFVFANTGQEHDKTLEFVEKCDKHLGLNLTWVEAVVDPREDYGTKHRIVTFETATRRESKTGPYFDMTAKYGIANKNWPHCTRELKLRPMYSYMDSIGWEPGSYTVAMGIRAEEKERLPRHKIPNEDGDGWHWGPVDLGYGLEKGFIYPLAAEGITKADVLDYWAKMPFDLGIEERCGNCVWCFKKSEKKHQQNLATNPDWYDFPAMLEERFSHLKVDRDKDGQPRYIFRGGRSTEELKAACPPKEDVVVLPERWTACKDDGTAESCEPDFLDPTARAGT